MKPNCLPCCQHCHFYHGNDKIVCGIHPYGPVGDTCHDFAENTSISTHPQTVKEYIAIRSRRNQRNLFLLLVVGLLFSSVGYGCAILGIIYPLTTQTHKGEVQINEKINRSSSTQERFFRASVDPGKAM